jgi:hypothetical protein
MVQSTNERNQDHPWDDNLPRNKEFIQNFYKKSEAEIKQQGNESSPSYQGFQTNSDNTMSSKTKITKVRKNSSGDITDVMMDNGNIFSIKDALMMAKDGIIEGVNVSSSKNGREFLRGNPNGIESDNLDNLPTF